MSRAADLLARGQVRRATSEINATIRAYPRRTAVYQGALGLYRSEELWRETARVGEALLAMHRSHELAEPLTRDELAAVYLTVGEAYSKMGDIRSAERAYRDALRLAPTSAQLLNALGYFLADAGIKLPEALRLTRRAARLAPDDGAIIDSLGWAQYRLGDEAGAIGTLRRAVDLAPDESELRYHLGAAYARAGRKTSACVELKKALVLNPRLGSAAKLLITLQK